ncbi:hypothetical protein P171DRAFT_475223 [Karstenula rhodostoma CBS 690.94]|uniref:Uncharacterized protein n=1 Tax=Karstenula rhodostoma CBS 690.94 TaxID=1392251 RepID=A0A9P4PEN9_9PLEO|nr:hypothetical protein P171DRAFT_475223 [Karstenula rhodostoma CBS 690.94]
MYRNQSRKLMLHFYIGLPTPVTSHRTSMGFGTIEDPGGMVVDVAIPEGGRRTAALWSRRCYKDMPGLATPGRFVEPVCPRLSLGVPQDIDALVLAQQQRSALTVAWHPRTHKRTPSFTPTYQTHQKAARLRVLGTTGDDDTLRLPRLPYPPTPHNLRPAPVLAPPAALFSLRPPPPILLRRLYLDTSRCSAVSLCSRWLGQPQRLLRRRRSPAPRALLGFELARSWPPPLPQVRSRLVATISSPVRAPSATGDTPCISKDDTGTRSPFITMSQTGCPHCRAPEHIPNAFGLPDLVENLLDEIASLAGTGLRECTKRYTGLEGLVELGVLWGLLANVDDILSYLELGEELDP